MNGKQDQNRENLQPARNHVKDQDAGGKCAVAAVVHGRTDLFQSGSDIVQGRGDRRKVRLQVKIIDRDQQNADRHHQEIRHDKHIDAAQHRVFQRLSVILDLPDIVRVDRVVQLLDDRLNRNLDPGYLDAAARGPGAGTAEHQQDQHPLAEVGPQLEVRRRISGCRDDRGNLERSVLQRQEPARIQMTDGCRDQGDGYTDDREIGHHLRHLRHILDMSGDDQVIHGEIRSEQDHEDRNHDLLRNRIARQPGVQNREASRAGRTKGQAEAVKQRHSQNKQKHRFNRGQADIHLIQDAGRLSGLRDHLLHARPRALRLHEIHRAAAGRQRDDRHDEYQDAHAADPVGK